MIALCTDGTWTENENNEFSNVIFFSVCVFFASGKYFKGYHLVWNIIILYENARYALVLLVYLSLLRFFFRYVVHSLQNHVYRNAISEEQSASGAVISYVQAVYSAGFLLLPHCFLLLVGFLKKLWMDSWNCFVGLGNSQLDFVGCLPNLGFCATFNFGAMSRATSTVMYDIDFVGLVWLCRC